MGVSYWTELDPGFRFISFPCVEEGKILDVGLANWQKACFVPTKVDALVVGFRRWLNKYAAGQIDWKGKFNGTLPPREQLLDRYCSHVVNCSSCDAALLGIKFKPDLLHDPLIPHH